MVFLNIVSLTHSENDSAATSVTPWEGSSQGESHLDGIAFLHVVPNALKLSQVLAPSPYNYGRNPQCRTSNGSRMGQGKSTGHHDLPKRLSSMLRSRLEPHQHYEILHKFRLIARISKIT